MNTIESLLAKIAKAEPLDFGTVINETIELFKKVWIKGFLIIMLIFIPAIFIGYIFSLIGLSANIDFMSNGLDLDSFIHFYTVSAVYNIPQTILVSTISLAFMAAFYRMCHQIVNNKTGEEDYFYFFKKAHFSKVFMLGIIYTIIASIAQFLFFIPYIYVFVPLSYFAVILADNPNLGEMDIVKASFALGNKKWFLTFGALFVAGLMGMLGFLACIIGALFTISIVYLPVFIIYKDAVGFNDVSEIDLIGTGTEDDFDNII